MKLCVLKFNRNVKFAILIVLEMKNLLFKFLIINILLFIVSCSTSNELNLNSRIQKRRYSNGYYLTCFKNIKKHKSDVDILNNEPVYGSEIINQNTENTTFASNENEINSIITSDETENIDNNSDSLNINIQNHNFSNKPNISKINNIVENKISNQTEQEFRVDKKSIKSYLKLHNDSKNDNEKLLTILFFVLAFILPPLSVLLYTNIDWKKVLIATLLTCLWWGPGVIYAILVLLEIL